MKDIFTYYKQLNKLYKNCLIQLSIIELQKSMA
jgi:hypothetical protein|nr:MAG TPA: hypothetical protein [Caudoviricetes sp.]